MGDKVSEGDLILILEKTSEATEKTQEKPLEENANEKPLTEKETKNIIDI